MIQLALPTFDAPLPARLLPRPRWHRTSRLSRRAAADAAPREGSRAADVLAACEARGRRGLTRDEIAVETGIPLQSACGVVRKLLDEGRLIETDTERPTRTGSSAAVLIVPDHLPTDTGPKP